MLNRHHNRMPAAPPGADGVITGREAIRTLVGHVETSGKSLPIRR
jgi:hypothetical protein